MMGDPGSDLWDTYFNLTKQHEEELDRAMQSRAIVDFEKARRTHRAVMSALRRISQHPAEGEMPVEEKIVQYIATHQMCGTEELTGALGISIDDLRSCLEKLGDRVFIDSRDAKARFWVTTKGRGDSLSSEELDAQVAGYMYRLGSVFPDECAVHLGVSVKKVVLSLQRQGFPKMNVMAQNGGVLTQYRPHEEAGI